MKNCTDVTSSAVGRPAFSAVGAKTSTVSVTRIGSIRKAGIVTRRHEREKSKRTGIWRTGSTPDDLR
jgi:hypothetical protein